MKKQQLTDKQKLHIAQKALELICKPENLLSADESNFLEKYSGEDQIAYDALTMMGVRPNWDRSVTAAELEVLPLD